MSDLHTTALRHGYVLRPIGGTVFETVEDVVNGRDTAAKIAEYRKIAKTAASNRLVAALRLGLLEEEPMRGKQKVFGVPAAGLAVLRERRRAPGRSVPPVATEGAEVSLRHLDPGIRDVVAALWERGLETTDSGDGVSKPDVGRVLDVEHVAIVPGEDPDATMELVADVITEVRPGEVWQVEHTRSRTSDDETIRKTLLAYRLTVKTEAIR